MYIREFTIDRFGLFSGQSVTGLPSGLTVIYGRNEAGKSTCLNFFRAMLFGYARTNRKYKLDYLADQNGGKALSGGGLLLESAAFGPLRLIRRPGTHGGPVTLTTEEGAPHPTADLSRLLGGCTPEVYDAVFGFSLGELIQMGDMKDERVRHALHGAAFGSERSPTQVLKKIQDEMDKLYVPKGRKTSVNALLAELEALRERRRELGSEVARYAALQQDLESLESVLAEAAAVRAAQEEERRTLERRRGLWRQWEALREAETTLAALPETEGSFAPDGLERVNRLAERLEERRLALAEATRRVERFSEELAALAQTPGPLQAHGPLLGLREQAESLRRAAAELPALEQEKLAVDRELRGLCASLGPEWDGEAVDAFPLSLPLREECRVLGANLEKAVREREGMDAAVARLEREVLEAEQTDKALAASSAAAGREKIPAADSDGPLRLERALAEARVALEQLPLHKERLRHAQEALRAALQAALRQASFLPGLAVSSFAQQGPAEELARLEHWLADNGEFLDEQTLERRKTLLREAQSAWQEVEAARRGFQEANDRLNDFVIPQYTAPAARLRSPTLLLGGAVVLAGLLCLALGFLLPQPPLTYAGAGCLVAGALFVLMRQMPVRSQTMAASTLELVNERVKASRNRAADAVQRAEQQLDALFAAASAAHALGDALDGLSGADALAALKELVAMQEHALALAEKTTAVGRGLSELRQEEEALRQARGRLRLCLDLAASLPELGLSLGEAAQDPEEAPILWLGALEAALSEWRRAGQERLRQEQSLVERRAALERLQTRLALARKDAEDARARKETQAAAWRNWLQERRLFPDLSPETGREALDILDKAKARRGKAQELAARAARLREDLRRFALELGDCARLMGEAVPELPEQPGPVAAAELLSLLENLSARSARAVEAAALQKRKQAELPEAEAARLAAQDELAAVENEMAELFRLARAEDAEAYRRAFGAWQQREEALQSRQRLLAALEEEARALPGGFDSLRGAFSDSGSRELDEALESAQKRLAEVSEQEQTLLEERGRLSARQAALAGEEGVMALRAEEERLLDALRRASAEWARLALAKKLLLDAKSHFEQERQPGVVRHAGELFAAVTNGAYSGLSVSLEDGAILALSRDGLPKNPETELSRGTREQLYLALRLAYIRDHSRQAESLPVIMDDILVNFDAGRAALTANALADFAREQQILFFTCHESTAAMLRGAAPDARYLRIEQGNFVEAS